jgi:hypothetical protein
MTTSLRILLAAALLSFPNLAARAEDNAAPAPASAAAPTQTEMQKWIATTDAQWQAAFKRDVTEVHDAETKKLAQQYTAALEAAITKASGAGDLDGALALREEQKRYAGSNAFPREDEAADAPALKQVRAGIRTQLARMEKDNVARVKALLAKYDQVLAQAQTQLTQRKRLDDALLVKNERQEVAAAWLAGIPAASAPTSAEQPKPPPPAPVPVAPIVAAAPEPEAAGGNLFKNPNFENGTEGWRITAWGKTGTMTIDDTEKHDGKPSLRVENPTPQHTLVNQKVAVKPKTRYLLAGYIKTKNVEPPKPGQKEGAELMVTGGSRRSEPVSKTTSWKRVTYTLTTLEGETEMVVGMSLGHYGATVKGTVWFSELSLTELGQNAKK